MNFELFFNVFNNYDLVCIIQSFLPCQPNLNYEGPIYSSKPGSLYRNLSNNNFLFLAAIKFGYLDKLIESGEHKTDHHLIEAILIEKDYESFHIFDAKIFTKLLMIPFHLPKIITKQMVIKSLHLGDFDIFERILIPYQSCYLEKPFHVLELYELALKLHLDERFLINILKPNISDFFETPSHTSITALELAFYSGIEYHNPEGLLLLLKNKSLVEFCKENCNVKYIKKRIYDSISRINDRCYNPDFREIMYYFSNYHVNLLDSNTNNDYNFSQTIKDFYQQGDPQSFESIDQYLISSFESLKKRKKYYPDKFNEILISFDNLYCEFQRIGNKSFLLPKCETIQQIPIYQELYDLIK